VLDKAATGTKRLTRSPVLTERESAPTKRLTSPVLTDTELAPTATLYMTN
jgi:hypothetical protein